VSKGTVFITGGAGFIGRWLVARCLEVGLRVAVYDNLCAGRLENIAPFLSKIDFFKDDILNYQVLKESVEKTKPDVIFHLAAHHFIPFCNEYQLETMRVNVEGTYSVLDVAARSRCKTVVLASTGAIYPSQDSPLSEDIIPVPVDVYGFSKLLCEEIARFFSNTRSIRCVVARLFNTYGPYETNPHLIPHIIASLHNGHRVELGNIRTKRDYIYVEDVANLLLQCSKINSPNYVVINIGTGHEYSAAEIIAEISNLMGTEIEIVITPERVRAVDKNHQIADITRLVQLTGCRPQHSLREGLRKLLVYEGFLP
jgi:UDP-glucose 4-epimerase